MRFAICDDQVESRQRNLQRLQKFDNVEASLFESGTALLEAIRKGEQFDIILLDIELNDMLGTELAHELRDTLPNADVVFISSHPQYVTDAFSVRAAQFLTKPVSERIFFHEMRSIIRRHKERSRSWCIETPKGVYRIFPAEIIYIQSHYRRLLIQTEQTRLEIIGNIRDMLSILEEFDFFQCHQSYLVNLKYIYAIQDDEIFCTGEYKIPIGTRRKEAFLKAYTDFLAR